MTTILHTRIPGTGVQIAKIPGSVRVISYPAEDVVPQVAHVTLDSDMRDEFHFTRCRHANPMKFTVPGWQAFIAAVKAGEFDGLLTAVERRPGRCTPFRRRAVPR